MTKWHKICREITLVEEEVKYKFLDNCSYYYSKDEFLKENQKRPKLFLHRVYYRQSDSIP